MRPIIAAALPPLLLEGTVAELPSASEWDAMPDTDGGGGDARKPKLLVAVAEPC